MATREEIALADATFPKDEWITGILVESAPDWEPIKAGTYRQVTIDNAYYILAESSYTNERLFVFAEFLRAVRYTMPGDPMVIDPRNSEDRLLP